MPLALVIRAPGTNCDLEVAHGFEMAGAKPSLIHLDALIREPQRLDEADLVAFPGGFSYGDDVASGRIFAMKLREKLYPALRAAAERGCPMIGICNGFQVLVQVGLLPGPGCETPTQQEAAGGGFSSSPRTSGLPAGSSSSSSSSSWPPTPPRQTLALADNKDARYMCRWVDVSYDPGSACIWTRGLADLAESPEQRRAFHTLPVGHGEGRLVAESPAIIAALEQRGQVALRYVDNFNGSEGAIAGVCDASGRIFGLMPHPDRFLDWTNHPAWTRLDPAIRRGETPGALIFRNAVELVSSSPRPGGLPARRDAPAAEVSSRPPATRAASHR